MNKETTSEVGFNPSNSENSENSQNTENNINSGKSNNETDRWRAIFEAQNRNFLELLKVVQNSNTVNDNKFLSLPNFNPDVPGSDAASWCSTAELILLENPLEGSALIVALSKCFLGSASQWLSTVCFAGIKWNDFKELFIQRFGGVETPAATISSLLSSQPKTNECLAVYASRLVTSLTSRWQNLNKEEIAVAIVLAHVARVDKRLRRSLFTTKISTRNELQQELKAFAYVKAGDDRETGGAGCPGTKRMKLLPNVRCHFCGKAGHKIADCRLKERSEKIAASHSAEIPVKKDGANIRCYKCGQPGHIASRCSSKKFRR